MSAWLTVKACAAAGRSSSPAPPGPGRCWPT